MVTIYHNPRCSKSRQTLALLQQQKNIDLEVIEYLQTPLDAKQIKTLLSYLNMPADKLLRKGEKIYKQANLGSGDLSSDALIAAMVQHPILIERPIVVSHGRAIICRPPEKVLDIL
ncbi:Arsenate reductase [uncultured Candidatus Thioglobus sp.]|nr:Arsenate reductase [uncultured Candidatus Thioglobus sp.]